MYCSSAMEENFHSKFHPAITENFCGKSPNIATRENSSGDTGKEAQD